jgi:hypothetical protein
MSRTKELKNNPENILNLFELLSLFSYEGKSKYTETLLRLMKKTKNIKEHINEVKDRMITEFNFDEKKLDEIPTLQLIFFYRIIDMMFNFSDLKSFQKFCEYNERGLIKQNDLSKYNSFEDILNSLNIAELNATSKDLEKQIKIVFEDDEWILVRPLTYFASKKYGSNTKWCTTQENNPDYFDKYSSKGVLIYCINKKSGYKVASFNSLNVEDPEFSFWNQKDSRIDSLETELTSDLIKIIFEESKSKSAKTNKFYLSEEERIKEEKLLKHRKIDMIEPIEADVPEIRTERVRRAIERVQQGELFDSTETPEMPVQEETVIDRMRLISQTIQESSQSLNYETE